MDEFFRYAEAAGMRGQVSHLNVRENTGAEDGAWEAAVERIERARREGYRRAARPPKTSKQSAAPMAHATPDSLVRSTRTI